MVVMNMRDVVDHAEANVLILECVKGDSCVLKGRGTCSLYLPSCGFAVHDLTPFLHTFTLR
jgi:hypothetical protein